MFIILKRYDLVNKNINGEIKLFSETKMWW